MTTTAILAALIVAELFLWRFMPVGAHVISVEKYVPSTDPQIVFEPRPLVQGHNAAGLRGHDFPVEKAPGHFRIALIGDSIAYGVTVPPEATYAMQLERRLNERGQPPTFEVLNLGVPGYDISQSVTRLRLRGLRYAPDLVIYGFWYDDTFPGCGADEAPFVKPLRHRERPTELVDAWGIPGSRVLVHTQIGRRLMLLRRRHVTYSVARLKELATTAEATSDLVPAEVVQLFLRYVEAARRAQPQGVTEWLKHVTDSNLSGLYPEFRNQELFAQWYVRMAELAGICRSREIPCVFLMTPLLYRYAPGEYALAELNEFVAQVARSLGFHVVDLQAALAAYPPEELRLTRDDLAHLSPRGHEVVARELEQFIAANRPRLGLAPAPRQGESPSTREPGGDRRAAP